ncbi:MAG: hypothetical protein WA667_16260 [Candidatus Nitrosopolaris sp.]
MCKQTRTKCDIIYDIELNNNHYLDKTLKDNNYRSQHTNYLTERTSTLIKDNNYRSQHTNYLTERTSTRINGTIKKVCYS